MGDSKSSYTVTGAHAKKTVFSTVEKNQSREDLLIADESPSGQEAFNKEVG